MPDPVALPVSAAVALRAVTRRYVDGASTVDALRHVTLVVPRSSSVAITGPSGSGKTTLLNIVAGLDRPTSGQVTVLGAELDGMSERRVTAFRAQHIGMVFQDSHLLPSLTALENVVIGRLPWEKPRVLTARARDLLEQVGLADRMDHPPGRLSGGERQRVGIARALLGRPSLLLADEPTGQLDSETTDDIIDLVSRLRAELGLTLVVATHDPAVAAIADRTVAMRAGTVVDDRVIDDRSTALPRELRGAETTPQ